MPCGVFDIVRVHGAMEFTLGAAIVVSARIVERNPPLPKLRRGTRNQLRDFVEPGNGLLDAALLEVGCGAIQNLPRPNVRGLPDHAQRYRSRKALLERTRHPSIPRGRSTILTGTNAKRQ